MNDDEEKPEEKVDHSVRFIGVSYRLVRASQQNLQKKYGNFSGCGYLLLLTLQSFRL